MGAFHEHIFFEDGMSPSNIGYGDKGIFTETAQSTIDLYDCLPDHYDDVIMRQAVQKAIGTGLYTAENYFLPGNGGLIPGLNQGPNCQNFVDRVLGEYAAMLPKLEYNPNIPGGGIAPAWP